MEIKEISQHEQNRDKGLKRSVGAWGMAFAIVNCVIGAGIFSLPKSVSLYAGSQAAVAFLICSVAMTTIVLCFAEAASRVPTSGGAYGYAEAALGPFAGLLCGIMVWLAAILACGGIISAFGEGMAQFFPTANQTLIRNIAIVFCVIIVGYINVRGADIAARFITIATTAKLVPLAIFVIIGGIFLFQHGAKPMPPSDGTDFGRGVILALFAFSGMETPLGASGEVANPQKNIPRALFISMGFVLVLYIAIQYVAQGLLGAELASTAGPLAAGIKQIWTPLGTLMLIGATFSRFMWTASDVFGAPRVLFAFARDGSLPKFLAQVHPKYATPHVAIIFHCVLAAVLALTGTFEQLAVLSGLTTSVIYILACAAAWKLSRDKIALFGAPLGLKFIPIIAIIGIASMIWTIFLGQKEEIIGLFAVIGVTIIYYFGLKLRARTN